MGRAVTDENLLAILNGSPEGGIGVDGPTSQKGWQVSPADQRLRDRARLAILEQEKIMNPSDPALEREVVSERKKQGAGVPSRKLVTDPNLLAQLNASSPPVEVLSPRTLKETMGDQANEGWGKALETGIADSASRTVRAIGTTLLPKAAEAWAEKHGIMPSARDIELLKAGVDASPAAKGTSFVGDVLTELAPATRVMRGANTLRQALPRAAAVGGTIGGMRSEEADLAGVAKDVGLGGVGGILGEGAGRALVGAATRSVRPSAGAEALMGRGIIPTVGDAADPSSKVGKVLRFLEGQTESMPITGGPQRLAKDRITKQLFDTAAEMGVAPGRALPTGSRSEVIDRLGEMSSQEFNAALSGTSMAAGQKLHSQVNKAIDDLAARHSVSDATADKIKQEMNQNFWAGIRNGQISGQGVFNFTEDMFNGLNSVRGNTNAQQMMNELATGFKNRLDTVAGRQGFDLAGVRKAAANVHALRRAGGTKEGVSGSQLLHGVNVNNRATGSMDATYDLQKLAQQASGITHPRNPMGNRNPVQFMRDFAGLASGGVIPAALLGGVNNSERARRLILGDPRYREMLQRALSAPATVSGANMMSSEEAE